MGMVVHSCNLCISRLRQGDCDSQAGLGYIVSSQPAWVTM